MNKHSPCQVLLEDLSDYLDGSASEALCAEIDRHLRDCPDCKIILDTLRKTITLFREREARSSLPPDVRLRLYKTLNLEDILKE